MQDSSNHLVEFYSIDGQQVKRMSVVKNLAVALVSALMLKFGHL